MMGQVLSTAATWAFKDNAGTDPKHWTWLHPLFVSLLGSATVGGVVYAASKYLLGQKPDSVAAARWKAGRRFLLAYLAVLVVSRVLETGPSVLYEMTWSCNQAMVLALIGMYTERPDIVGAAGASIAFDQALWYLDMAGWLITGKFPLKVAAYLEWPETTFVKKITAGHHLFFLPLCVYLLRSMPTAFSGNAFKLGVLATTTAMSFARAFTPFSLNPPAGSGRPNLYLNINLAYECWKDVKVPFFHMTDEAFAPFHIIFVQFFWSLFNVLPFFIMRIAARRWKAKLA